MNFAREEKLIEKLTEEGQQKLLSGDFESAFKNFEAVLQLDSDNLAANTMVAQARRRSTR